MGKRYRCIGCGAESISQSAPCRLCGCKRFGPGSSARTDSVDLYQHDVRRLRAQLRRLRGRRA
jgi:ribosomal protein L19E